jgi:hypothetical protein
VPNDPTRHRRPRINIGVVGNITGGTVIAVGRTAGSDADDELSIDRVVDGEVAADDRDSVEPLRWQATRLDRADGQPASDGP